MKLHDFFRAGVYGAIILSLPLPAIAVTNTYQVIQFQDDNGRWYNQLSLEGTAQYRETIYWKNTGETEIIETVFSISENIDMSGHIELTMAGDELTYRGVLSRSQEDNDTISINTWRYYFELQDLTANISGSSSFHEIPVESPAYSLYKYSFEAGGGPATVDFYHHSGGDIIDEFNAVHMAGDSATTGLISRTLCDSDNLYVPYDCFEILSMPASFVTPTATFVAGQVSTDDLFVTTTVSVELRGDVHIAAFRAAPVPEPETYAMLLAGLGLVGVATRRRHGRFI